MAETAYDVIVLGVGVMGAAACLALARRGLRVLGIDQYSVPNALGASHGHTRMTRSAYYEHPDYVPLIRRANELWRKLESETGVSLLNLTGAVYIGEPASELIAGSKRAAEQHGLAYRMLSKNDLTRDYPEFHVPESHIGLWEQDAGTIFAELAVDALAEQALRLGADIHGHEKVIDWHSSAVGVTITTDRSKYPAAKLIICGGPWSSSVIADLGVKLTVTRQVLGWVWPKMPTQFGPDRFVPFAVDNGAGSLHYGFPILPGAVGMKVASHALGQPTTTREIDREVSSKDETTFRPFVESIIPNAAGPTLAMRVCMYTNSPDSHFILDRLPKQDNVTIGCGFSGHGFKFAPVIGEALADLALEGRSGLPISFLTLKRFE